MNIQTSRIHKIDVGTPPTSTKSSNCSGWEIIEVHYHGFKNLTTTRGQAVFSPEFMCFGHQWCLRLYPGGRTSSVDGMVSTFLYNMSDKGIKVKFGFSVKNKSNNSGWRGFLSKDEGSEFAPSGGSWGRDNFCKRTQLIENLVDGTLIVEIRMKKIGETTTTPFIPENPIAKNILSMFNDEESADVIFEVENEKVETTEHKRAKTVTSFHAHRNILHTSSALLGELCKSGANVLSITHVTPDIFRHLLYYLYGGKIADEELKSNAKDVIDAADKYGIVGLKLEAEAAFVTSTTITFENAIDNLLYADATNCALIKEAVMDFIAENRKEATKKLAFNNVPGHVIPDLLTAMNRNDDKGSTSTDANDFSMMRVSSLRKMLHEKGLDIDGSREMMIARLEENP